MVRRILERGHRDFPRPQAARHPQHRPQGDEEPRAAGRAYDQPARRRRPENDAGRASKGWPRARRTAKCARPLLIAVTQLTSTSAETLSETSCSIDTPMEEVVAHYAANAAQRRDWTASSARRSRRRRVKRACGQGFLTVTPGVRFADGDAGDQVRITTPATRARDRLRLHRGRPRRSPPPPTRSRRVSALLWRTFTGGHELYKDDIYK